jgi:hypothetical protein
MALNQSVLWFNEPAEICHFLLVQGPEEGGGGHICPQWKNNLSDFFPPLRYLYSDFASFAIHFVVFY